MSHCTQPLTVSANSVEILTNFYLMRAARTLRSERGGNEVNDSSAEACAKALRALDIPKSEHENIAAMAEGFKLAVPIVTAIIRDHLDESAVLEQIMQALKDWEAFVNRNALDEATILCA